MKKVREIKRGNTLFNAVDIFGNKHEKCWVTEVYRNTFVILDCDTKTSWIVHKKTVGVKPDKQSNWLKSKEHFDLKGTQRLGIDGGINHKFEKRTAKRL